MAADYTNACSEPSKDSATHESRRLTDQSLDDIRLRAAQAYSLWETGKSAAFIRARTHLLAAMSPEVVLLLANEVTAYRRARSAT